MPGDPVDGAQRRFGPVETPTGSYNTRLHATSTLGVPGPGVAPSASPSGSPAGMTPDYTKSIKACPEFGEGWCC